MIEHGARHVLAGFLPWACALPVTSHRSPVVSLPQVRLDLVRAGSRPVDVESHDLGLEEPHRVGRGKTTRFWRADSHLSAPLPLNSAIRTSDASDAVKKGVRPQPRPRWHGGLLAGRAKSSAGTPTPRGGHRCNLNLGAVRTEPRPQLPSQSLEKRLVLEVDVARRRRVAG
jgi:hypothetical protein